VLTKSRWWLTKSSGGARVLGDRTIEDYVDTCRENGGGVADTLLRADWWFGPQNHWWTVFGFGPQNSGAVPAGIGAGTLRHHEACAKAKLSNEWRVAVGTTDV